MTGSTIGRALSNLDAAEASLLRVAPDSYLAGQMPSLRNHVQRHLEPDDPRRQELERLAGRLGPDNTLAGPAELSAITAQERNAIVSSVRAASKAALREQLRVRSFRNVLLATSMVMTLLAVGVAVLGFINPAAVPLCFQPERSGQTVVVCPTQQSALLETGQESGPAAPDVDDVVKRTAGRADLLVVELIGLTAAATALRGIRGLLRALRPPRRPCHPQAPHGRRHRLPRPAAHAGPVRPRPQRPRHLRPDPRLGAGLRLRPAAVHPPGRPAGP
jgi:hypothetical protein